MVMEPGSSHTPMSQGGGGWGFRASPPAPGCQGLLEHKVKRKRGQLHSTRAGGPGTSVTP